MNDKDDQTTNNPESESIYRAPSSDTRFAPGDDALAAYVGPKNADYYKRKFDQFRNRGGSVSWHWPAFFVTSVWLLYRKMWLNAFLYWIVLPVVLGLLSMAVTRAVDPTAGVWFYYGTYFLISLALLPAFANRIYYQHAQSKVDKVASIISSTEHQSVELARIGGTSKVILVVLPFLLIVVVGVLAAIAIPAYQDYTVRVQVSEGLDLSGGAKAAVAEHYFDTGELAANNEVAGLAPADRISGAYVSSVTVSDGDITIEYGHQAHTILQGKTIVLMPEPSETLLSWSCVSPTIKPVHLPAACR